jgi:hypothetical protein
MSKFQGMRKISLTVSLSLIITCALLIHADFAGAGGLGKIGPNQGFETAILLRSQSYILSTTQATAFGIHGVNILSAFNERLEATLEIDKGSLQPGTWLVLLWGVGGGIGGVGGAGGTDMHFGLTSASGMPKAKVFVGTYAFGIALVIINLTSPSEENPLQFQLKIETPVAVM